MKGTVWMMDNDNENVLLSKKKSCKPVYLFCYNKL